MSEDFSIPPAIDPNKANIARVYDAFLGGKDNYDVDRVVMNRILSLVPEARQVIHEVRQSLVRVIRYMVLQRGICQFIDFGSGLPTQENVHQVAQHYSPEATVVYVDHDELVAAHARALLEDANEFVHFVQADIRNAHEVIDHPKVRDHIDWDEPVGLILWTVLHHVDDEHIHPLINKFKQVMAPKSLLAISHFTDPDDASFESDLSITAANKFKRALGDDTTFLRSPKEIRRLFDGLLMVPPGLVRCSEWWPYGPDHFESPAMKMFMAAVGEKIGKGPDHG